MPTRKSNSASGRKSTRKSSRKSSSKSARQPEGNGAGQGSPPHEAESNLPQADPRKKPFNPETLDRTVIAIPLLRKLKAEDKAREENPNAAPEVYAVVIDLNQSV